MLLDMIFEDHGFTTMTAGRLIELYGDIYSHNYLRTVLSNSEAGRDHSMNYPFRTMRVERGVYMVLPSFAQLRRLYA